MMGIISRFIRHGTAKFASFVRQRPITNVFVATVGVIVAVMGVGEIFPGTSKAAQAAVVAAIADPASLFDARSPGNRRYGRLQQTKQPRTGLEPAPSSERVLTSERQRPVAPAEPSGGLPIIPGVPVDVGLNGQPEAPASVAGTDSPPPTAFFGGTPGAGGPVIGGIVPGSGGVGGGGGAGGGGTPGGGNPVVPPPVAAVPEPTTWIMMFLGLFGIGIVMRRRPGRRLHGAL